MFDVGRKRRGRSNRYNIWVAILLATIIHYFFISMICETKSVIAFTPLSIIHGRQQERFNIVPLMVSSELEIISNNEIKVENQNDEEVVNIVLLAGFESFNKELYINAASSLLPDTKVNLQVFSDSEIRTGASIGIGGASEEDVTNPAFIDAMKQADIFIGSLIFDYDDVVAVEALMDFVTGPRLIFECATELMSYNRVGTFSMEAGEGEKPMGPPPMVKAVLSKFSSGKEEDKISGYLKLLKM